LDTQNVTISNVIIKIQENLNMTLESNVLTLVSGSVLTDSGNTYHTITIDADKHVTIDVSGEDTQWIVFARTNGTLIPVLKENVVSGMSDDMEGITKHAWFNTSTKEILYYENGTTDIHVTYPLCSIDIIGDVAYFTKSRRGNDLIFNGIGFVGHHAFVLPGIEVLIPDGIREDNDNPQSIFQVSLNNTVSIRELPQFPSDNRALYMTSMQEVEQQMFLEDVDNLDNLYLTDYCHQYVKSENFWYYSLNGSATKEYIIKLADFTTDAYKHVLDFTFIYPVKLKPDDDFEDLREQVETNTINIAANTAAIATKAEDDLVVHKAGNEIITGTKTFSTGVSENRINFQTIDYGIGDTPSTEHFSGYKTVDKNGIEFASNNASVNTQGTVGNILNVSNKKSDDTIINSTLGLYIEKDGTSYATAPTPTENTSDSIQIDTVGARNQAIGNKVDKVTTSNILYGTDNNGNQTTLPYQKEAVANKIPQRTSTGDLFVPETPTNGGHATSKKYVDTGLNTKQDTITGAATTIVDDNLTNNRALISNNDGKVAVSNVTSTELSYVSGVTSSIQDQLNTKSDDSNVVHKTGNETIAGTKTFSTTPVVGTLAENNNSTSAASTAYVTRAIATEDAKVVHNTGVENVAGIKTFTDGITIPANSTFTGTAGTVTVATQTKTDSSTKAASTAFVKNNLADYVPTSRKINNKALTTDITLTYSDVDALPDTTTINDLTTTAQQNALNSGVTSTVVNQVTTNKNDISTINSKIPAQASSSNQLADKNFVNSSIQTNTATFDGSWNTYADIPTTAQGFIDAGFEAPTNNNYLVVKEDETQDGGTWRYKYASSSTTYDKANWKVEYEVNETPMTAEQLAALNSGITSSSVAQITTNKNAIGTLSSLSTTEKSNLVDAINELDSDKVDANTAITGATKCKITYDSKGLVTAGANLAASDIPNLASNKITAMTGYSKATGSNAIETSDSLNTAIGKLEYKADNAVVANSSITGATHTKITYDSKGLVTAGTDLSASDIPSLTLSKISDITASAAELNVLDGITASTTELNYTDGVTSNIQNQLNAKQDTITGAATTIVSSNLTASRALISNSSGKVVVSDVTSTELGYLDGVTSAIQTQLNNKVEKNSSITGATKCKITYDSKGLVTEGADLTASDIPSLSLSKITDVTASASEVNVLDGITASTTELNYVDGVTSNIQDQLDTKAVDNNVVHKTGDETIDGIKTFQKKEILYQGIDLVNGGVTKGTNPESTQYWGLFRINDKTNSNTWANTRLGIAEAALDTTGQTTLALGVYKNEAASTNRSAIVIGYNLTSGAYATAPSPSASNATNTTNIATTGWVNNPTLSTNVVHRTADETIDGNKTFTGILKGQAISYTNHAMELGHSGKDYMNFWEYGGLWNFYKSQAGTNTLIAKIAELTTSTNDESLATTAWVNNKGYALDADVVHKTGNETVAGNKTFTNDITANSFIGNLNGDNYIQWGGPNLTENVSPSDAGCIDDFGHNKASYWRGLIDIEYTTDGTTWIDYGATDIQKWQLVTRTGFNAVVGKGTLTANGGTLTNENVDKVRARITLHIKDSNNESRFYSAIKKILLNVSTAGAGGTRVNISVRTIANYIAGNDIWVDKGTYNVSGWSGWNSIPFVEKLGGYNNQTNQYGDLRIEIWSTFVNTSNTCCAGISDIRLIGVTNWIVDDFAKTGYIYSFDKDKNVIFPATVSYSTPAVSDNSTKGATTAWVKSQGYITSSSSVAWNNITGTPTTISGYGITDAYTKTEADGKYVALTGNQTVAGVKTFNNEVIFKDAARLKNNITPSLTTTRDTDIPLLQVTTNTDGKVDGPSINRFVKYNANGNNKRYVAYRAGFRNAADTGNIWPTLEIGLDESENRYAKFDTQYALTPTPTEDTTSSTQIDTVGARNTKLQNYVPTSRKINNKALTADITLSASDVGALPSSTVIPTITDTYSATSSDGMSGKAVASAISNKADKATSLSGYGITDAYTKTEIDGKLSGAMHFKGTKASVSNLPTTGNVQGDMWNVTDTGANYAWDGSAWDKLSENIDLSGVVPTSRKINNKALTADITLSASDVGAVASNTAITGATKCKITYDSKGLVTAGANLDASDIPNLSLSKITDVTATATEVNVLDGITATTAELNYTDGVTSNIQTQLNAKAADNDVVHKTGNETIAGTKTFSSPIDGTINTTVAAGSTKELLRAKIADNDYFRLMTGGASNAGYVELATADDYNEPIYVRQYQGGFATLKRTATLLDGSGNTSFPGTVSANRLTAPVLDGSLVAYQTHNGETGNLYRKLGEIILTGQYQSVVVPFFYYKDAVNTTEVGYQGKISLRVDATAGVIGTSTTGVVLSEYPDWINNGNVKFYVLYKNNTPESNQATCEIWSYVKNAWDGCKIVPMNYHGYGRNSWTWYDNIAGVESLPDGYSQIEQKYGRMYTTAPSEDTTTSKQIDTVGARNTKLASYALDNNVVHKTGDESISGVKTFTQNNAHIVIKTTSANYGEEKYGQGYLHFLTGDNKETGYVNSYLVNATQTKTELVASWLGTNSRAILRLKQNEDGSKAAELFAPTEDTTSSIQIDTVGARNTKLASYALDANVVHKTGNETIGGIKTFTSSPVYTTSANWQTPYEVRLTNVDYKVNPSDYIAESPFAVRDKNNQHMAYLQYRYETSGESSYELHARARNTADTANVDAGIKVAAKKDGTVYTSVPTPTEDNTTSTQIDTVGARNTKLASYALDANVVHKSGTETINDVKTFTANINANTSVTVGQHAVMSYNSTTEALEFSFI